MKRERSEYSLTCSLECLRSAMSTIWCLHHLWWFLRNFEASSITFDEEQNENILFKIVKDVSLHSLQSALTSVFYSPECKQFRFTSHVMICLIAERIMLTTTMKGQVLVICNVKDENSSENRKRCYSTTRRKSASVAPSGVTNFTKSSIGLTDTRIIIAVLRFWLIARAGESKTWAKCVLHLIFPSLLRAICWTSIDDLTNIKTIEICIRVRTSHCGGRQPNWWNTTPLI